MNTLFVKRSFVVPLISLCTFACVNDLTPDLPKMRSDIVVDDVGRTVPLVCPGAEGCASNDGPFRVGVGKRTITPVVETDTDLDADGVVTPLTLAGFAIGRIATGVHDELWTRALILEQGDVRIGIVSIDVVGMFHAESIAIREKAKAAGLDVDHIVVATTHNHEGPDTMGIWGIDPGTTGYDQNRMNRIHAASVDALLDAADTLTNAHLTVASGDAGHLVNDTRIPYVVDPRITGLKFTDDDDDTIATLAIYGNHPEALGDDNTLVSSDFPHYLRERLESSFGGTAVFVNGPLGGLTTPIGVVGCPDAHGAETCPQGTFERAAFIGEGAADVLVAAFANDTLVVDDVDLALRRELVFAPGTNKTFVLAFKIGLLTRDAYTLDGERITAEVLRDVPTEEITDGSLGLSSEVNAISLGPVEIITAPGELYTELFLLDGEGNSQIIAPEHADLRDEEPETPLESYMPGDKIRLLINNANDALGYIIPVTQWDQKEPFALVESGQYGEQVSVGAFTARSVDDAVKSMYTLEP